MIRMTAYILACVLLSTTCWCHIPCFRQEDEIIIKSTARNRRYNETPFKVAFVSRKNKCMGKCLYERNCLSLNEVQEGSTVKCELFNTTNFGNDRFLTGEKNSNYYEVQLCPGCKVKKIGSVCTCECSDVVKRDCLDWLRAGYTISTTYFIEINGEKTKVFCDMETRGGGWVKIQNRFDGSVDFNQSWAEYKIGFGEVEGGEFWLGLEKIFNLVVADNHEVYIEASSNSETVFSLHSGFKLANETQRYRWTYDKCLDGACSPFSYHKDQPFYTYDKSPETGCPAEYSGGWWYQRCLLFNMNGGYYLSPEAHGIAWSLSPTISWYRDLRKSVMMVRRKST